MTDEHDPDEGLAPVTDLFGARPRRGRPAPVEDLPEPSDEWSGPTSSADGVGPAAPWSSGAGQDVPDAWFDAGDRSDDDRTGNDHTGGDHSDDDGETDGGHDRAEGRTDGPPAGDARAAAAPIPLRRGRRDRGAADADGAVGDEPEWRSPVVGDGSGRSARAEQTGYDDTKTADAAVASVFAIGTGDEIDPADAPRPLHEQRADAERLSMRALGRKGVSTSELRQVLTKHDLDPDVVEHEVERLTRVGLLDDVALATDLVDRLHDRKGLGRQAIVAELRRRGIDQTAIEAALEAAADDADDEFVRAIDLAEKRARQLRGLDRATAERRLSGFLMRKGYGSSVVRIAVERALDGSGRRGPGGGTVRFE